MSLSSQNDLEYVKQLAERLWPICRSICGPGLRNSLDIVKEEIGLNIHKYSSGTKAFDWIIPQEWDVNSAYIETLSGKRIVDFSENNLHLMNYSTGFEGILPITELHNHLYSIPSQPDVIPYRTSYYKNDWGFCISHNQLLGLSDSHYRVFIDAKHTDGFMEIGEHYIKGECKKEMLFWTHLCHPSMANDQLSGPLTLIIFAKMMSKRLHLPISIRICFAPETIGSLAYLSENRQALSKNMVAGLACVLTGGEGPLSFRQTRSGTELIDEICGKYLSANKERYEICKFNPAFGNDQRQFCSPGINLPMGSISCTANAKTTDYHTSLDNLNRLNFSNVVQMAKVLVDIYDRLCNAEMFFREQPDGELFLSKYELYPQGKNQNNISPELREALLWLLNLSDGKHSFSKIIELSKCDQKVMRQAVNICIEKGLIKKIG